MDLPVELFRDFFALHLRAYDLEALGKTCTYCASLVASVADIRGILNLVQRKYDNPFYYCESEYLNLQPSDIRWAINNKVGPHLFGNDACLRNALHANGRLVDFIWAKDIPELQLDTRLSPTWIPGEGELDCAACTAFATAGNLGVLQELHALGMFPVDLVGYAFAVACVHGRQEIAKWISEMFELRALLDTGDALVIVRSILLSQDSLGASCPRIRSILRFITMHFKLASYKDFFCDRLDLETDVIEDRILDFRSAHPRTGNIRFMFRVNA